MLTTERIEYRDNRHRIGGHSILVSIVKLECFPFYVQGPIAPSKDQLLATLMSWHGIEHVIVYINDIDAQFFNLIE